MSEGLSMAVVAASESEARALVGAALANMRLPERALLWVGPMEPGVWEAVVDADVMRRSLRPRPASVIGDLVGDLYAQFGERVDA